MDGAVVLESEGGPVVGKALEAFAFDGREAAEGFAIEYAVSLAGGQRVHHRAWGSESWSASSELFSARGSDDDGVRVGWRRC